MDIQTLQARALAEGSPEGYHQIASFQFSNEDAGFQQQVFLPILLGQKRFHF